MQHLQDAQLQLFAARHLPHYALPHRQTQQGAAHGCQHRNALHRFLPLFGRAGFEPQALGKGIGVFLGLFGVALLTRTGPLAFNLELLWGALACLGATTCYGFAGFLTRRWIGPLGLDNRLVAFASLVGASLFQLPLFAGSLAWQPPTSWGGPTVWLSLAGLGLVCTAFAYVLYFRLLADIGPIKASTTTFLIPPFGILWGYLVLGETLTGGFVFGGAVVCLAVWLVTSPARAAKPAKAQA